MLFVVLAIAQLEVAVAGLVRPNNLTASALAAVNLAAAAGWITTRFVGISWIDGLQQAEDPGLADTIAAVLAGVAVVAAASYFGTRDESRPARAPADHRHRRRRRRAHHSCRPSPPPRTSTRHAETTAEHDHAAGTDAAASDDGHAHTDDATATATARARSTRDAATAATTGTAPITTEAAHGHHR